MSLLRAPVAARLLGALLLCLAPLAPAAEPATPPARTVFPAPLLHSEDITYTVVLYHPTPPKGDVVADARKLLTSKYKELASTWKPGAPAPEVDIRPVPTEELEPIEEYYLRYFGRRLNQSERKGLMGAKHATKLSFHVPFARRNEALLAATRFAHQLASERGAILWDAETREYYSPQRWKEERLDGWSSGAPIMSAHITMHAYGEGESIRIITLGMAKFGLPDLVVEQVPQSMTREMGKLVNGVAQLLAEGLELPENGTLDVDLTRVKNATARSQLEAKGRKDASKSVKLRAFEANRDKGDPENHLIELAFPGSGTTHARQLAALDALFGKAPDSITPVKPGDPELEAVATKARARLNELRPRVEKGLHPPEELTVKAGFPTDDGSSEHMWFVVTGWDKDGLRGTLANEPFSVKGLRRGSLVSVPLKDVDDYIYTRADGTEEGGESSRILMRREEGR
ncbi:DUF2314 domain-containing protein [Vitiosangium sp. GDMCC 1.1324]|uniref:DUF2314 domain-containing protein n=1 Tax=Vitiosangium sp. (strain GDMCC 1.1324) TaxID=2138576 RepID=UPI00130E44AA|nr:DUF2314 domain-containing protein [Vitiosangium sp. GDMCC 1.1324]